MAGRRDGEAIRKQFTFKGFPEAVAFVTVSCPMQKRRIIIRTSRLTTAV
jgi:hypothetical protein